MKPFKITILALGLAVMGLCVGESFGLCLPLYVKQTLTVARTNVPVQSGIPLPIGAYQPADVTKFMVLDSTGPNQGNPIPAAFAVNATWIDGSIRFLNVQFQATVASNSTKTYYLSDKNQNMFTDSIAVTGTSGTITVETGVLKFTVKGTPFNLIDEAFVDLSGAKSYTAANQIVQTGHNGGFVINGQRSSGGNATVTLYRKTREQVTLKATGTVGSFPYLVFITAYRAKPYVKIWHNFYYNNSTASSSVQLTNVSLELPTLVTGARQAYAGCNATRPAVAVTQAAGDSVYAISRYIDRLTSCGNIYRNTTIVDSGTYANNSYLGWIHTSAGNKGIGIAIRFFWEMHPKIMNFTSDGRAVIGLYSYKAAPLTYYAGGGRTHQAIVCFGADTAFTKQAWFMLSQPMYPRAPAVWYCGMTKSLGDIVHADPALFYNTTDSMYAKYQYFFNRLRSAKDLNGPGNRLAPGNLNATEPATNLFGFVAFGDNTDPTNGSCLDQQHYSGNYYDYPHVCLQSFIMNGEQDALIRATECDLQMADIEHMNTTGDSRGCPVVDHWFCYQCPSGSPARCATLQPWGNANHWKTQSQFETWWLTGEPMYLELGKRINTFAKTNNGAITTGEARSAGHILMGLAHEYEAEWDVTVRDRMRWFWLNGVQGFSNSCQTRAAAFLNQVVIEGLIYAMRCDPTYVNWRTGISNMVTSMAANYDYTAHLDCQNQYPDLVGGELGSFAVAMDSFPNLVAQLSPAAEDIHKTFFSDVTKYYQVNTTRQKLYTEMVKYMAFWFHRKLKDPNYLNNFPAYKTLVATLEVENAPPRVFQADAFDAKPNPFNPQLTIRVNPALSSFYGRNMSVGVYDVTGRLIEMLNAQSGNASASREMTYVWNAVRRPAGIYMIQVKAGDRIYSKKVTFLR